MKSKAYFLVFDGLADWEAAHALCEINKSRKLEVVAVGLTPKAVTTMGGLRLTPDATIGDVDPAEAGILILPGGEMWERGPDEKIIGLLRRLSAADVSIAAICGATLEVARAGLTRGRGHTSNSLHYLKEMVAGYGDEDFYVEELAVADGKLITASGLGSVEFGREVIRRLDIYSEADAEAWFGMFKHGLYPAGEAAGPAPAADTQTAATS